jgi:hypothetical protein
MISSYWARLCTLGVRTARHTSADSEFMMMSVRTSDMVGSVTILTGSGSAFCSPAQASFHRIGQTIPGFNCY